MKLYNSLTRKKEDFKEIVIQCHDNPDADALASGFALYCFFKESLTTDILKLFISFFCDTSGKTKAEILSHMIISVMPYILIMLILAFNLIGAHLCLIFTFFKKFRNPFLLFF